MEPTEDSGGARSVTGIADQLDEVLYRWDELRRRPAVAAAAVFTAVVVLGGGWFYTSRSVGESRPPVDDRIPVVSLAPTSLAPTMPPSILVHVAGAVERPGVYEIAAGQRVIDAIAEAGGATPEGQPDRLNLAAPVVDGMQIRVPIEGEAAVATEPGAAADGGLAGPVNLNTATGPQLESLPGVGPATAAAILAYREEAGSFGSVSDLLNVRGIGEAKLAALRDLVTVQ